MQLAHLKFNKNSTGVGFEKLTEEKNSFDKYFLF